MVSWEESSKAVGYKVNKLNALLRSEFQGILHKAGWKITPEQWGTIHFLIHNPGSTQTVLASASRRDQTSITRLLDGLQRHGLIERRNDQSDRRIFRIFLTEEAERMYMVTFSRVEEFNLNLKKCLSDSEGEKLIELMDKLYQSLIVDES